MARGTQTLVIDRSTLGQAVALVRPAVVLKVTKGPDRKYQQRVEALRLTIGAAGCDLNLSDPTVSAVHCELRWTERGLTVRDVGSRNGVLLQGRRVLEAVVEDGDALRLGATTLEVSLADNVKTTLSQQTRFGGLIGSSVVMRSLYATLERIAQTDATVLIQGETGVGKDLVAEAIVDHGPRRSAPVVVLDCGAVSASLIESELFGHEKGAFTGADRSAEGVFERAHKGTLVLDAVCELPLALQAKLLGALERRVVQRLGSARAIPIDARVIAISQMPLDVLVNQGQFRADLYYRLAAVQVHVAPLRERLEDVPALIAHFLAELGGPALAPTLLDRLCTGHYPGNVRQLRSALEQVSLGLEPQVSNPAQHETNDLDLSQPLIAQRDLVSRAFERRYLAAQLGACDGNVSMAARKAGLDRMHLHRLLQKHGLAVRKGNTP